MNSRYLSGNNRYAITLLWDNIDDREARTTPKVWMRGRRNPRNGVSKASNATDQLCHGDDGVIQKSATNKSQVALTKDEGKTYVMRQSSVVTRELYLQRYQVLFRD